MEATNSSEVCLPMKLHGAIYRLANTYKLLDNWAHQLHQNLTNEWQTSVIFQRINDVLLVLVKTEDVKSTLLYKQEQKYTWRKV